MDKSLFDWLKEWIDYLMTFDSGDWFETKLEDIDVDMIHRLSLILDLFTPYPNLSSLGKVNDGKNCVEK